ncbi:hypothetical protein [Erythrobacter dokdonensis]|nr:hypothetical protein [Erythrobacter dokdonensis]
MMHPHHRGIALLVSVLMALAGCGATSQAGHDGAAPADSASPGDRPPLALMTSLPLYWPQGAGIADLAAADAPAPWQRKVLERDHAIYPLDTLSPAPALSPDAPEVDPLAGLARLAVIQPRGLSPADNVALDAWVREGGRLLLVLDPALTGEYDLPLGDPRRPVDSALIPPVVARWGMAIRFDDAQEVAVRNERLGTAAFPLVLAGQVTIVDPAAGQCTLVAGGAAARCAVGQGRVTLLADAAVFEHPALAGEEGEILAALLAAAFE